MTIFIYPRLSGQNKDHLRRHLPADATLVFRDDLPDGRAQNELARADVLLGNPPLDWLTGPLTLQWWQLDSAGFDKYTNLTLPFPVANMGDLFAWPCAETIVAGILALYRHIPELTLLQAEKRWVGVSAPRCGCCGAARGGARCRGHWAGGGADAAGFACSVQFLARTDPTAALHSPNELRAVLPETDLIINCLPGTLTNFFDAGLIAALSPGSVFANVGRGSTVDEPALIQALQTGHLGGAVLDVTATEPLPADNPLWAMPNVVLTQHTGGGQPGEEQAKLDRFLKNWHHFRAGEPLSDPVTLGRGTDRWPGRRWAGSFGLDVEPNGSVG